ncbi:MAG: N-acetyltransferase [Actinobacteria bacterium]|nr:N-acetyltransferase [Actinomycetota bacterium]
MRVRLATLGDAEAIRAIYNPEVLESTVTFDLVARTLEDQLKWIDEHSGAHPAIVAVEDGVVAGYGSLSAYKERPAYRTSVEDSVYVHRAWQDKGVGRLLLSSLVGLAADHGFHAIFARIVGDHDASIALHERCGFETIGVEKEVGRKFNQWLDVVVMQLLVDRNDRSGPALGD